MSYVTLPSNKQNLVKSPSMNEKMGKVGLRLYNIAQGVKDSCQGEKVLKVPIVQKSFNL